MILYAQSRHGRERFVRPIEEPLGRASRVSATRSQAETHMAGLGLLTSLYLDDTRQHHDLVANLDLVVRDQILALCGIARFVCCRRTVANHLETLNDRAPASVAAYVAMAQRTTERALGSGRLKRHEAAPPPRRACQRDLVAAEAVGEKSGEHPGGGAEPRRGRDGLDGMD